jgi:hypothetical protein
LSWTWRRVARSRRLKGTDIRQVVQKSPSRGTRPS